jgi:hypothetical protein
MPHVDYLPTSASFFSMSSVLTPLTSIRPYGLTHAGYATIGCCMPRVRSSPIQLQPYSCISKNTLAGCLMHTSNGPRRIHMRFCDTPSQIPDACLSCVSAKVFPRIVADPSWSTISDARTDIGCCKQNMIRNVSQNGAFQPVEGAYVCSRSLIDWRVFSI